MSYFPPGENPYASPQGYGYGPPPTDRPGCPKAMFIVDLVFCGIRVPLALLSVVGAAAIPVDHPLYPSVILEVLSSLGIAFLGVPANILGLMKKRAAFPLGMLCLLSTLVSIATGIWQITLQHGAVKAGTPEAAGFVVGIVLALGVRVVLNIAYLMTLLKYNAWFRQA